MSDIKFLGARIEKEILSMVEETAKDERIDKSKALKQLIALGRKQYLLQKNLSLYRDGKCSIDKAAEEVGITVSEMMHEAVNAGITSAQTMDEYSRGLKLLLR